MIKEFKLREKFPNKFSKNYVNDQNPMILGRYLLFNIDTIKISITSPVHSKECDYSGIFSPSFFQEGRIAFILHLGWLWLNIPGELLGHRQIASDEAECPMIPGTGKNVLTVISQL